MRIRLKAKDDRQKDLSTVFVRLYISTPIWQLESSSL